MKSTIRFAAIALVSFANYAVAQQTATQPTAPVAPTMATFFRVLISGNGRLVQKKGGDTTPSLRVCKAGVSHRPIYLELLS